MPDSTPDHENSNDILNILKAGSVYFLIALGAGIVLEVIRLEIVALHISQLIARMMEIPNTLLAMIIGAQWVIDRFTLPPLPSIRLGVGSVALGIMVLVECIIVLPLHGLSLGEYFAGQDAVVGILPFSALGVLAAMPLLVGYRWER